MVQDRKARSASPIPESVRPPSQRPSGVARAGSFGATADPIRFPRASAFLAGLPEGIHSYPECQQKASLLRGLLDGQVLDVPPGLLPAEIIDLLADPPPANVWLPVATARAAWLAVLDARHGHDDEAALADADRSYRALARSSMYSRLLRHMPPAVVARGSAYRWSAIYRGITVEMCSVSADAAEGVMRYPANSTPRFNAISTARGLEIALRASAAKHAEVELVEWTPTFARYEARWTT